MRRHRGRTTSPTALVSRAGFWRITESGGEHSAPCHNNTSYIEVRETIVQPSMISGILLMRGSVKTSFSSVLVLENSEMTAPSEPDWNQWRVFGGMVYWWPGSSSTSWNAV